MLLLQFCSSVISVGYKEATAVSRVAEVLCGRNEYRKGRGRVEGNRKVAREIGGAVEGDIEQEGRIGVVGKGLDRNGVRWLAM